MRLKKSLLFRSVAPGLHSRETASRLKQMALKLRQAQVWKTGDEFIRIVKLERLTVSYKIGKSLKSGAGQHQQASKKEFCRLIKSATLVAPETLSDAS